MTKRELFKKAHQIAKETVKAVGDYRIALKLALKELHSTNLVAKNYFYCHNAKGVAAFLKEFFRKRGFSSRQVGVRVTSKYRVRIIRKDSAVTYDFVYEVASNFVFTHDEHVIGICIC